MTYLAMPQLGESVTEGTIIKWLKNVGDHVGMDEALVEIETEKVNVEVPSPWEGLLTEILVPEGETVAVGTDLATIEESGGIAAASGSKEGGTTPPSYVEMTDEPAAQRLGDAVPSASAEEPVARQVEALGGASSAAAPGGTPPAGGGAGGSTAAPPPTAAQPAGDGAQQRYSPAVLRLAQEHQIDLRRVPGSGLSGRVTRKDVMAWLEREGTVATQPAQGEAEAPAMEAIQESIATPTQAGRPPIAQEARVAPPPSPDDRPAPPSEEARGSTVRGAPVLPAPSTVPAQVGGLQPAIAERPAFGDEAGLQQPSTPSLAADEEIVRPSATRRAIAQHMVRSVQTSPHAWMVVEIDLTRLVRYRESLKTEFRRREGIDLSYLPFMIKATVQALKENPRLNATWRDGDVVLKRRINVGIAVNTEEGLMVPVIHDADNYSIAGLARAANDLAARARSRRLKLEDVQGGTFTVDNTGVFGSVVSAPIINQPQAAIVTMEAIVKRPVVVDDAIAVRSMMNSCISFDHRVVDGGEVGPFMQSLKRALQAFGEGTPIY